MLESQAGSQSCAGAGCETEVSSSRLLVQHCWTSAGCAKSHSDRFLVGLVLGSWACAAAELVPGACYQFRVPAARAVVIGQTSTKQPELRLTRH